MKNPLPNLSPTELLKFFNFEPLNRLAKKGSLKPGESGELELLSLFDYLSTIPRKHLYNPQYIQLYHNAALNIAHKLMIEGLISPVGTASGIYQKYKGTGFDANKAENQYYNFLIYGFPEIVQYFKDAIRIIEVKDQCNGQIDVGTVFAVLYAVDKQYFVTAKHCLPKNDEVRLNIFLGKDDDYSHPIKIYVHEDDNVDVAILEFSDRLLISDRFFRLEAPSLLDRILVSGYPPVPGTTDAILVSSTGEITAIANNYFHKYQQIYINANVKGGSSGSPIINSTGNIVGIVIESPRDVKNTNLQDELHFGTGLTSDLIRDILLSINGAENKIHKELKFKVNQNSSFTVI
jgi:hypothetical protein